MHSEQIRLEICESLANAKDKLILSPFLLEIENKLSDGKSITNELSEMIELVPGLGKFIVNAANSPFYKSGKKALNTSQAILAIGFEEVAALAKCRAVMESFSTIKSPLAHKIMAHGISAGIASSILAEELGVKPQAKTFLAGLVHDIGKAYLCAFYPEQFDKFLWVLNDPDNLLGYHSLELLVFGISHNEVGAMLLDNLGFSEEIISSTLNHHPGFNLLNPRLLASIVYLGDIICNQTGHTPFAGLTLPCVETSMLTGIFEVKRDFGSAVILSIINSLDIEIERLKPFTSAIK